MLDKQQTALGPEHASHLAQGAHRIGDRAEGPRGDHHVGNALAERNRLRLPLDPLDRHGPPGGGAPRYPEKRSRRIEAVGPRDLRAVVREIEPGASTDLDDDAGGQRDDPSPLGVGGLGALARWISQGRMCRS